jgi:hypothetical protein
MIIEHHRSMYKFFKKHYLENASLFVRLIVPGMVVARATFFVGRNEYYRTRKALAAIGRQPASDDSKEGTDGQG